MKLNATVCGAMWSLIPAVLGQAIPMPVAQQNALVQKHCAVCHTDAHKNGGLSLQHFDAARRDPSLAAMMASKVKNGAMGAAGISVQGEEVEDALFAALSSAAVGATEWNLDRAPAVTASIVREGTRKENPAETEVYRLKLSCDARTRQGEAQLTWSPQPAPSTGRVLSAAVDGRPAEQHAVEGSEKMGNGSEAFSGPAAFALPMTRLPEQSLTISGLFPQETVVFPFSELTPGMRQELSACFAGR